MSLEALRIATVILGGVMTVMIGIGGWALSRIIDVDKRLSVMESNHATALSVEEKTGKILGIVTTMSSKVENLGKLNKKVESLEGRVDALEHNHPKGD